MRRVKIFSAKHNSELEEKINEFGKVVSIHTYRDREIKNGHIGKMIERY